MSGGYFDYQQYKIDQIADQVEQLIIRNDDTSADEYNGTVGRGYNRRTIKHMKDGLTFLRLAAIYAQRIDWLVSGDDGEDSFDERLEREIRPILADIDMYRDSVLLECLRRCGVDNWDGYDDAIECYHETMGDE